MCLLLVYKSIYWTKKKNTSYKNNIIIILYCFFSLDRGHLYHKLFHNNVEWEKFLLKLFSFKIFLSLPINNLDPLFVSDSFGHHKHAINKCCGWRKAWSFQRVNLNRRFCLSVSLRSLTFFTVVFVAVVLSVDTPSVSYSLFDWVFLVFYSTFEENWLFILQKFS